MLENVLVSLLLGAFLLFCVWALRVHARYNRLEQFEGEKQAQTDAERARKQPQRTR